MNGRMRGQLMHRFSMLAKNFKVSFCVIFARRGAFESMILNKKDVEASICTGGTFEH